MTKFPKEPSKEIINKLVVTGLHIFSSGVLWLFLEKFLRLGTGMLVGVWVARYMGPNQFGMYCLVISLFSIIQVVAKFGLEDILSRKLIEAPGATAATLGTFFHIKFLTSLAALAFVYLWYLISGTDVEKFFLLLTCASLVFSPFDVLEAFFQVNSRLQLVAWGRVTQLIFSSALKIWFVFGGVGLEYFFILFSIDAVTLALVFAGSYFYMNNPSFIFHFDREMAKSVFFSAIPILVSNVFVILYMKLDQIIVAKFLGNEELGLYGASLRLLEVWYMLPVIAMNALYPLLLRIRKKAFDGYLNLLQKSLSVATAAAIFICVVVSFCAIDVVVFLFGKDYSGAGYVLRVQIWSIIFVYLGVIGNSWIVSEGLQKYLMYKTSIGLALSLVISVFLVYNFGLIGAAFSSLISQFLVSLMLDLVFKKTRYLFFMKINSFRLLRIG